VQADLRITRASIGCPAPCNETASTTRRVMIGNDGILGPLSRSAMSGTAWDRVMAVNVTQMAAHPRLEGFETLRGRKRGVPSHRACTLLNGLLGIPSPSPSRARSAGAHLGRKLRHTNVRVNVSRRGTGAAPAFARRRQMPGEDPTHAPNLGPFAQTIVEMCLPSMTCERQGKL